jgi:hypothetical protein
MEFILRKWAEWIKLDINNDWDRKSNKNIKVK